MSFEFFDTLSGKKAEAGFAGRDESNYVRIFFSAGEITDHSLIKSGWVINLLNGLAHSAAVANA